MAVALERSQEGVSMPCRFLPLFACLLAVRALAGVYEEDFSVTNAAGRPYGIVVDRVSHYSHGHGRTMDGRYAILVHGAKHRLAMPDVREFALTARVSLSSVLERDVPLGMRLYFRYDRKAKTGDLVELFRAPGGRLTLTANGRVLAQRTDVPRAALDGMQLTLAVTGETARVSVAGLAAAFPCAAAAPSLRAAAPSFSAAAL